MSSRKHLFLTYKIVTQYNPKSILTQYNPSKMKQLLLQLPSRSHIETPHEEARYTN